MPEIVLKKIWHREHNRIAAFFRWDDLETRQKMKRLGGIYSRTYRCWHFFIRKRIIISYEIILIILSLRKQATKKEKTLPKVLSVDECRRIHRGCKST
jgi:hypothetical protein